MSFLHTPFSLKKDNGGRKSTSSETTEMSDGGLVFGEESASDFWPVQHPIEPPHGETPVECPMPNSSLINHKLEEWRRKGAEPTNKRRHSVSHDRDLHNHRALLFHDKFRPSNASSANLNFMRHINPDKFRRY